MVQKAFEWAEKNGRKRKNPVHGEEEIRIVLSETFALNNTEIEEREQSGTVEVQVPGS